MKHMHDEKLKILFITSDKWPPFRPAARVIFGEQMVERGHTIDWLIQAHHESDEVGEIRHGKGRVLVGPTDDGQSRWHRLKKHLLDIRNDLRMFSLMRRNHYDIIQVKDKYLSAILAIVGARLTGAKFCFWLAFPHAEASLHEVKEGTARYRGFYAARGVIWKFILYRIILPAADHVFVQSEQMKRDIAAEGIAEEKMTPVPGSVSLANIPYDATGAGASVSGKVQGKAVVYLGTLNRTRRLDFLVRVFSRVVAELPDARLYLLGRGDSPEDEVVLQAEVARLGLDQSVEFVGFIPMSEAWEYIRDAAVCVSPYYPTFTLLSTSPTKLIEYMAMGKAVVGNDHPEQRLVIEESGAGICTPWEERAFANAILSIANDPEGAAGMGLRGRRFVEQYRTNSLLTDVVEGDYLRVAGIQSTQPVSSCSDAK